MQMRVVSLIVACCSCASGAVGQPAYNPTPDWTSSDHPVSTGGALVDLDHDGWLDLVVANGNDMAQEHVAVYYNQGDGTYPSWPDWQSIDNAYNGHLDVADVNGDGWLDIAVAHLGNSQTVAPIAKVYFNNAGTLSSLPDWEANIIGNAFGVAFGDMNGDGRPDLAVATGWAYGAPNEDANVVYVNTGGTLGASPRWVSDDTSDCQGAAWMDADGDGWLDLAYAASNTVSRVYRNLGGMLETTASWQLTDIIEQDAIMVTAGDVTGDGVLDLLVADNNQIGGSGRFRQYDGQSGGLFETTASWSYYEGYCSAVALADIDADGDLDLATGGWWKPVRLFYNDGGALPATYTWATSRTSVIEKISFGDIDKNGLRPAREVFAADGDRRLFYLAHQPIQEITAVVVDGQTLGPADYTCSFDLGWVALGRDVTAELEVAYTVSSKLDMSITNWDNSKGNYVYYNQLVVMGDANCDGRVDFDDIDPFVALLSGGYEELFPDCDGQTFCDMDGNGQIDFDDIDPFVDALGG